MCSRMLEAIPRELGKSCFVFWRLGLALKYSLLLVEEGLVSLGLMIE